MSKISGRKEILAATVLLSLGGGAGQAKANYDCTDFQTWEQAQQVYAGTAPDDPHGLDGDGNGVACEALRLAGTWQITQQCQGRDIRALVRATYLGRWRYSLDIENTFGERAKGEMTFNYGAVNVVARWNNGVTIRSTGRASNDWRRITGRDSFGCDFIAVKQ